ncbi:MAG: phosphoribosylglycinamide formyltransferase [Coriobacteriales bacterium]|jgi:phosphoribosylglycinamide formyltransferase-1|nr:phosphoribosylglycinamide formyltransferase [Coriobacteriales bacterium]
MIKLGVLISGSGTNLQAIIDAIADNRLDASIELVVSSRPDAYGIKRARDVGIPTIALSKEVYREPLAADRLIVQEMKQAGPGRHGVDYVVMAGYMRMVRQPLLEAFPNRIINIHPALLPAFIGAHGIADAFAYGVKITGVTVHFANENYDRGPIIAQRTMEIAEEDNLESLEQRIHDLEHVLYPEVLQLFAEGRVVLSPDRKVQIR